MLCDCLEVFKKELEKYGDALVLDSYIPADGSYVLVDLQQEGRVIEQGNLKWDKKEKKLLGKEGFRYYHECVLFDYNSRLVDMNKPMDSKKIIHSNNYLSFFVKKESVANGKLTQEIIDNFYAVLEHPAQKYEKSKKTWQVYAEFEKTYGNVCQERLKKCQEWIKKHIFSMEDLAINVEGKDYLKIFFLFSTPREMQKDFIQEGKRYLLPNIYNSNDYNQIFHETVYGLPNNNISMNAKKPYLEHKTRGNPMPYLLDGEQVLLQKKFFDYLMNFASRGDVNIYVDMDKNRFYGYAGSELPERDFQGIYIRIKKGKELEIHDMDVVSDYRWKLPQPFQYRDYLGMDFSKMEGEIPPYHETIGTLGKLQKVINEVAFSKFLTGNYFVKQEELSIHDPVLKRVLVQSREALFAWFYKGVQQNAVEVLKASVRQLVYGAISNGYIMKAKHIFNLYYSIKVYDGKEVEHMKITPEQMKERLRGKINQETTTGFSDDEEYYFAVGQMVSFFISKSKMSKKNHSLANPFIQAKNNEIIRKKLKELYIKYNYDIAATARRFNQMYAMISIYEPDGAVNTDMILAGYLCDNLIYEKKDKMEEEN